MNRIAMHTIVQKQNFCAKQRKRATWNEIWGNNANFLFCLPVVFVEEVTASGDLDISFLAKDYAQPTLMFHVERGRAKHLVIVGTRAETFQHGGVPRGTRA
jgi:hypothetical protein